MEVSDEIALAQRRMRAAVEKPKRNAEPISMKPEMRPARRDTSGRPRETADAGSDAQSQP